MKKKENYALMKKIWFPGFVHPSCRTLDEHYMVWSIRSDPELQIGFVRGSVPFPVIARKAGSYEIIPALIAPFRFWNYMVDR